MAFLDESVWQLSALAGAVLGQRDLPSTLTRITQVAVGVLPLCDGASIPTPEEGRPGVVAADGDLRIRDLADDGRWPFYTVRSVAAGARSSASLPLTSEGQVVGSLRDAAHAVVGSTQVPR